MRGPNQVARQFDFKMRQYDESQDMAVKDARQKALAKQRQGQSQRPHTALSTISRECQQRLQQLQQEIDEKNGTIRRLDAEINRLGIQEQKLLEIIQRERAEHEGLEGPTFANKKNRRLIKTNYIESILQENNRLEQEIQDNLQLEGNNSALQQKIEQLTRERDELQNKLSELGRRQKRE